jgi:serine phosphatase RsbU (regulator of sigma subunit)
VWLAALWLAFVVVAELLTGPDPSVVLAALYSLGPLIACATSSVRATAGFAIAALVLATGSGLYTDTFGSAQQGVRLVNIVLIGIAAVTIAAVRVRREQKLARLSRIAEVAQRTILPTMPAHVGPVAVAARYVSAVEDTLVGGDLYDFYHSQRNTCFIVGDVRGKGVGAVEQAARVIRAFRQAAAGSSDLPTIAREISTYLVPYLDDEEFVTAALVRVEGPDRLTTVSCGHPPPLLSRAGVGTLVTAQPGLPLGFGDTYRPRTLEWARGDRLLLYTDGLSEARDATGEFIQLESLAPGLSAGSVNGALDGLLESVQQHSARSRLTDDLAVLLLENTGSEHGPLPAQPSLAALEVGRANQS